jgi:hypothetical protein
MSHMLKPCLERVGILIDSLAKTVYEGEQGLHSEIEMLARVPGHHGTCL